MAVKPIPDDYPQITPYLVIDGAAAAIDFYKEVFGTTERLRMGGPDGRIGHAELQLGNALVMLADEYPEMNIRSPRAYGGSGTNVSVYVTDVDAVHAKALSLGATEDRAVQDQFYGDRTGSFTDPWGHKWSVATHVEDVSPEEMQKRAAAMEGSDTVG
jgi:PhnB protein